MNSVSVDGKNYVKAKDLARDLGYTADYVGQLCRGGKVDAQLVGRSWYVSEDSLNEYKRGRYRSNKKETLKVVERALETEDLDTRDSFKVSVNATKSAVEEEREHYANQSFYTRATPSQVTATYHGDETELIPGREDTIRTGRIGVHLADAQNVKIASKGNTFDFDPTQRQQLRFKGKLSVMEFEDESEVIQEEPAVVKKDEVQVEIDEVVVKRNTKAESVIDGKASKIKVKHRRPSTKRKKKSLPLEQNSEGVLSMYRSRIVDRNPVGGTLKIDAEYKEQIYPSGATTFISITTVLIAIVLGVLITSLEQTTTVVGGEVIVHYTFDFESILATAYDAIR